MSNSNAQYQPSFIDTLINIFIFLYVLSVLTLDSIPFYSKASVSVLSILLLLLVLLALHRKLVIPRVTHIIVIFLTYCMISVFWSFDQLTAVMGLTQLFSAAVGGGTLLILMSNTEASSKASFIAAVFLGCVLLCVSAMPEIVAQDTTRVAGLAINPNSLMLRLCAGGLILLSYARNTKKPFILNFTGIFFILFAAVATSSRKALFVLLLLSFFWVFKLLDISKIRQWAYHGRIVLTLIALLSLVFLIRWDFIDITENLLYQRTVSFLDSSDIWSGEVRKQMIIGGLKLWSGARISGIGIDQYRVASGFDTYSHNNYVELLANLGLLGFFIYYSIYIWILALSLSNAKTVRRRYSIWSIAIILLLLMWDVALVSYSEKLTWIIISWAVYILLPSVEEYSGLIKDEVQSAGVSKSHC